MLGDDASLVKMRTKKEIGINGIVFKRVTFLDELFEFLPVFHAWFAHLQFGPTAVGTFAYQFQVSDCHCFERKRRDTQSPVNNGAYNFETSNQLRRGGMGPQLLFLFHCDV
jgi:hypothetical protein